MKKLLIATTALVATTGVAIAEVNLSGLGRFGLDYNSGAAAGESKTQVNARLRFNIDASVDTDAGVTFGGRIRVQWDDGRTTNNAGNLASSTLSPAMLYATANGFRVEVGNANTAIDSVALMYNSEIGYLNRSFGNPIGSFYAFSSVPFEDESDRMGVFASYSIDGLNLRASVITPDQVNTGSTEEVSISADYRFGDFTVAGAYAADAGGNAGEDVWFLGAQYAVMPGANVGLLYFDNNTPAEDWERVTLYGNYRIDAITYRGYIARDNRAANSAPGFTKTAFGLGIDYDLGGARLGADVHRNYSKDTIAGLGVRFDF